jgi:hypothetical protein
MAALENNNLGMSSSEDQAVTENQVDLSLDLSTADSPIDPLNDYNLDNIQAQNNSVEQGTPAVNNTPQDPPTKKKVYTEADIVALENQQRKSTKEWAEYGSMMATKKYVDPNQAARKISFDSKKTRLDRYLGYGTETFNKVGFSPFANNEEVFNKNTTMWQDYKRMSGNAAALTWLGFKQNFAFGALDFNTEEENTRKYQELSDIGMSSKGGVGAFGNNLILNGGYGIGVGYSILTEELLMLGAEGLTFGGATPLVAARTAQNLTKLGKLRAMFSGAASSGFKSVELARTGLNVFKSLKGADKAKDFYTSIKTFGKATGNFLNPLARVTDDIMTGSNVVRNASNMAKMSKTFGSFYRDVRDINVALGESKLEGGTKKQEVIDFEINKYKEANGKMPEGKDLQNIYAKAEDVYQGVVGLNLPIIYYTNRITFDGLFKFRGFKTLEQAGKTVDLSSKGIKFTAGKGFSVEAAKKWSQVSLRKYPGMMWNYSKRNISEGLQENLQNVISDGVGDYYDAVYKDPTLGGFNFAAATAATNLKKEFTSARGAETFLTGFLMGAVAGPAQSVFLTETPGLYYRGKDLVMKTNDFKAYKAKKAEQIKEKVTTLNELYKNPLDFFSATQENAASQNAAYTTMMQAEDNGDAKTYQDTKDISLFNHVFTSINNGTFDDLIDGYKQMAKLDPKELADYLKVEDVTKAKDKIQEVITRAEQIQSTYNKVNSKFQNPFNPSQYKPGDPEHEREAIAYTAFERAKRSLAVAEHGFERSIERMESLYQDISTNRPIEKSSNSDYSILLNAESIKNEIYTLRKEIASFGPESQQNPEQKKLAKQKLQKLEDLQEYRDNLDSHLAAIKSQESIQNGEFVIQPIAESYESLRNSYKKYLKNIAKLSGDYVFDNKIDDSFDKLADYYSLNNDAKNLSNVINTLLDPTNLYAHAETINDKLNKIFEDRGRSFEEQMESYSRMAEMNALIEELAKAGVVIDQDEFVEYIKSGKRPTKFLDKDTGKPVDPESEKAKDAQHAFDVDDQIKNRPSPTTPNVTTEAAATPTEAEPTIEEELVAAGVSEEEQALRKAYRDYLSENPDADVSYEDFVTQSAKAARIKKDFAQKKVEPVAVEPIEEAPAEPTSVAEAPVVKEEVAEAASVVDLNAELEKQFTEERDQKLSDLMPLYATARKTMMQLGDEALDPEDRNILADPVKYLEGRIAQGEYSLQLDIDKLKALDTNNPDNAKKAENLQRDIDTEKIVLEKTNVKLEQIKAVIAEYNDKMSRIGETVVTSAPDTFNLDIRTTVAENLYKQLLAGKAYADFTPNELNLINTLSFERREEIKSEYEETQRSAEKTGTQKAQDLINSVSSIRDLPNLNSSVANGVTVKIIALMRDNPDIKASDVTTMIDVKRKEFIENLQTSDLKPGDIITFADGKKGMVKKSSNQEVSIKLPRVADVLVLNQEDLSKRITMVEAGTVAKAKAEPPVEIAESDKKEVEASRDAVDGFTSNAAKVQELNKEILANTGKDNSANVNNLIDKLGCKTNAK